MKKSNWLFLFPVIIALTSISSLASLLVPDFYFRDSAIIAMKCDYLDLIHLAIFVPVGILMFILAMRKSYSAKLFIIGMMAYLGFMFGFNALSLFFNELFLVYVTLFSLNIFGIVWGYIDVHKTGEYLENSIKIKISAAFLMLFAVTAYYAWSMEFVAFVQNGTTPESIADMNLPTPVVHVFDMAVALPMIIYGAVQLFRNKKSGLIISSVMVTFVFLTCISVFGMELALYNHNMPFDEGKLYSMSVLATLSIYPLITLFRAVSKLPSSLN